MSIKIHELAIQGSQPFHVNYVNFQNLNRSHGFTMMNTNLNFGSVKFSERRVMILVKY